jgi:transposase-like protein
VDRASLEQLLSRGLSLAEIGRRFGLHEATVSYWVEKHGLEAANRAKHMAKGGLAKDELVALVETGATIATIAETLGRSKATVRHWLAKYGLRTRGGAGRRSRDGAREAREAGLTRVVLLCPHHGESQHVREPRGYFRCGRCRQDAVIRRRRKVKEILVREAGGCCRLCGYSRCLAALEFHHVDPSAKQFGVAQSGAARSIERLRAEVRKCVLLCSNCHAEVECGFSSISGVVQMDGPG